MLEILKTHLRKKTAEIAAAYNVKQSQIEIIWFDNDFYYKVIFSNGTESEKIKLSL